MTTSARVIGPRRAPNIATLDSLSLGTMLSESFRAYVRESAKDWGVHEALRYVSDIIGGYGVEYIASIMDTSRGAKGLSYVNMGDTYKATVIYDHKTNRFLWGKAWGDVASGRRANDYR